MLYFRGGMCVVFALLADTKMEAAACMVVALLHIGTAKWMDRHYG